MNEMSPFIKINSSQVVCVVRHLPINSRADADDGWIRFTIMFASQILWAIYKSVTIYDSGVMKMVLNKFSNTTWATYLCRTFILSSSLLRFMALDHWL